MTVTTCASPYSEPRSGLYAALMAKRLLMGVQDLRGKMSERVKAATDDGEHTVVAKRGRPVAVLVPIGWYRQASAAIGDPTEF